MVAIRFMNHLSHYDRLKYEAPKVEILIMAIENGLLASSNDQLTPIENEDM